SCFSHRSATAVRPQAGRPGPRARLEPCDGRDVDGAQDVDVAARLRAISRADQRTSATVPGQDDPATSVSPGQELRQRALASALDAYTAVHGHPVGAEHAEARAGGTAVRWATRTRVAVAATVALALVV